MSTTNTMKKLKPKKRALKLLEKYFKLLGGHNKIQDYEIWEQAKQCALICVKEIRKSKPKEPYNYTDTDGYWEEVEKEIEKL